MSDSLWQWGFSRQEYWSGLPYPPPGDLSNPGLPHYRQILAVWFISKAHEYWSGEPIPSPGGLPDPGIELGSPALQVDSFLAKLPEKLKLIIIQPRKSTPTYLPKTLENICSNKKLYKSVNNSIIHNSQKVERIKIFISLWINKCNISIYCQSISHKAEWSADICHNIDEPQNKMLSVKSYTWMAYIIQFHLNCMSRIAKYI